MRSSRRRIPLSSTAAKPVKEKRMSEDTTDRYSSVEIYYDTGNSAHRVRYMECVEEGGTTRFVNQERILKKGILNALIQEIVRKSKKYGR